jgi:mono/diheme cytochrome c family protein
VRKRRTPPWVAAASFLFLTGAGPALLRAADPSPRPSPALERGAALYAEHCARCHGPKGEGDGPQAEGLRFRPTDLTLLSRGAGGRFPAARVTRVVDGRRPLEGHGGPEMPIWGDLLKSREAGYDERDVSAAIASIVAYVESIQRPRGR